MKTHLLPTPGQVLITAGFGLIFSGFGIKDTGSLTAYIQTGDRNGKRLPAPKKRTSEHLELAAYFQTFMRELEPELQPICQEAGLELIPPAAPCESWELRGRAFTSPSITEELTLSVLMQAWDKLEEKLPAGDAERSCYHCGKDLPANHPTDSCCQL